MVHLPLLSEKPRIRLAVRSPSKSLSHRLLVSYFLWLVAEKGTVIRPLGVDLEGSPGVLLEPYLASTLGFCLFSMIVRDFFKTFDTTTAIKRRKISCSFGSNC